MMGVVFVGLIILLIFAIWDYELALLPNLPVLVSIIGYGLFLMTTPIFLLIYLCFIGLMVVLWLFYAKNHSMSLSDSLLFGLFGFCSAFLNFYPIVLFIFLVAIFYKTSIGCHYEGNKKLVKMIPPMFLSLLTVYNLYLLVFYILSF